MQPVLRTTRLILRPVTKDDVSVLWALWTAPDVRRFLWDDREITREEAADTLEACGALSTQGLGLWMLEAASPSFPSPLDAASCLGCAGLLPVSTAAEFEPRLAGLVEPLVALAPPVWGGGYATEALAALLGHANGALGLEQLAGVTDVPNTASDRMLRRAGFQLLSEVPGPRHPLRTYLWRVAPPSGSTPTPR